MLVTILYNKDKTVYAQLWQAQQIKVETFYSWPGSQLYHSCFYWLTWRLEMQRMRFSLHDNHHRTVISFPHFLSDVAFYLCQAVYVLTYVCWLVYQQDLHKNYWMAFNITWTKGWVSTYSSLWCCCFILHLLSTMLLVVIKTDPSKAKSWKKKTCSRHSSAYHLWACCFICQLKSRCDGSPWSKESLGEFN